jgi:hypothetical protein
MWEKYIATNTARTIEHKVTSTCQLFSNVAGLSFSAERTVDTKLSAVVVIRDT